MTNECIPFYQPGAAVTAHAGGAIDGKRFVDISANRQAGPALNTGTAGGNIIVTRAGAGVRAFGVAAWDAASGEKVTVYRTGAIVPVIAGATIAAGVEVECDSTGRAITLASGKALGKCLSGVTVGLDAQIALY